MLARLRLGLSHRLLPFALAILAVLLTLPALWVGWQVDDFNLLRVMLHSPGREGLLDVSMRLFAFTGLEEDGAWRLMESGVLPWWTFEELRVNLWRPFTALTHWLDGRLWPASPELMHAQSLLWLAGAVALATLLYRRVMGATWIAGLAALLFVIDDAHGTPAAWIANRNALIALFFGLLTLIAHDRWRRDRWRPGAFLALACFALGLLSAEAGVATVGYLFAYALFLDRGALRGRVISFLPYAAVMILWRIVYDALGFGAWGSGTYIDPVGEPLRFARALINRGPVLFLAQWALPPSEFYLGLSPAAARGLSIAGGVFMVLLGALMFPLLRRDRVARFWALGSLLSLVPICATFIMDRLLLFAGLGAFGLLAQFLGGVFGRADWLPTSRLWKVPAFALGALFVLIHGIAAPLLLPARTYLVKPMFEGPETQALGLPIGAGDEERDVVILAGDFGVGAFFSDIRIHRGLPVPAHWRVLAPPEPIVLVRLDESTLLVVPVAGYLAPPTEATDFATGFLRRTMNVVRAPSLSMELGQKVELPGMSVEVTAMTADGRPAEATFRFPVPLEDPSLIWLRLRRNGRYTPFTPPAIGATIRIE